MNGGESLFVDREHSSRFAISNAIFWIYHMCLSRITEYDSWWTGNVSLCPSPTFFYVRLTTSSATSLDDWIYFASTLPDSICLGFAPLNPAYLILAASSWTLLGVAQPRALQSGNLGMIIHIDIAVRNWAPHTSIHMQWEALFTNASTIQIRIAFYWAIVDWMILKE